jgi:tight adherence protein C
VTAFYTLLFGILISGIALTLLYGLRSRWQARAIEEERLYSTSTVLTLEEVELSQPFGDRVLRPAVASLLGLLGRLTPQRNVEETQHKLEVAGHPNDWTVADFMGLRILSGALATGMAFTLTLLSDMPLLAKIVLVVAIGLLGYFLPVLWLGWRIRARQSEILRALPDGLDMLNICVGAGLGFDAALSRVSERWQTALADEFNRVVLELRLGKPRRQALEDLANRTEVMEVENFVATIVQADQLGVSIAKVLRAQAEQMRIVRRQRAEELARQATIKLLFPLVLLIFPSMLAVLLGPAVPSILETLGRLGQ